MRIDIAIEKTLRSQGREFHLDLHFASDADVTVLFGPSGAGKTQTLYAIAGLTRPDHGSVRIDNGILFDAVRKIDLPSRQRGIGFVFQDYALFPHLNILQNVAFPRTRVWPLRPRWKCLADAPAQIRELMTSFGLNELAQSFPAQLSGGQRQRIALARALASRPKLLLLDEPFAALDAPLRKRLRDELLSLRKVFNVPMIVITHDPDDVAALGGYVVAIQSGRVADANDTFFRAD